MTAATVTEGGGGAAFALEWACEWPQAASTDAKITGKMKAADRKYMGRSPQMTLTSNFMTAKLSM
jgi:hypothetical protein